MNWPIPMEAVSPSPVTPRPSMVRLAIIAPVAMEGMRPWHGVESVRGVEEEGRRFRRTADAGELADPPRLPAHLVEAFNDPLGDGVMAAAGAQSGLGALVVDDLQADVVHLLGRWWWCGDDGAHLPS